MQLTQTDRKKLQNNLINLILRFYIPAHSMLFAHWMENYEIRRFIDNVN